MCHLLHLCQRKLSSVCVCVCVCLCVCVCVLCQRKLSSFISAFPQALPLSTHTHTHTHTGTHRHNTYTHAHKHTHTHAHTQVVLPEGASSISADVDKVSLLSIDESRDVKYTYLDTSGRPVVVLHTTRVVPDHATKFSVDYAFGAVGLLREPLLLIAGEGVCSRSGGGYRIGYRIGYRSGYRSGCGCGCGCWCGCG